MKYLIVVLLSAMFVFGCSKQVSRDRSNLTDLSIGMSKNEVTQLMGHKPYKTEAVTGGKRNLEVLYYITEKRQKYRSLSERKNMTPILLEDGKVIGWGWRNFDDTTKRIEIDINR